MSKPINWRKIVGAEELCRFKEIADFLVSETRKRDEQLEIKHKQYSKLPDGGEEWRGRTLKEAFGESLADEAYESDTFAQVVFQSLALSILSYVERDLRELCNHLHRKTGQTFSVKDLRGNGMRACIEYLDRILENGFMRNDADIKSCHRIRNVFAHGNVCLTEKEQDIFLKQVKDSCFKFSFRNNRLVLSEEDLFVFIEFGKKVWEEITNQWIVDEDTWE